MLQEMGDKNGLKFITLRLGTIFGISKGMRFHTAVNKFCWQAVMDKPITVWKTAMNQRRPYLGLLDAINIFKFIMDKNLFDNKTYNVVTTNTTVKNIINIIMEKVPKIKIKYVDNEIMNQSSYNVSNNLIIEKGFLFKDDLKKGIFETIDLLKS